MSYAFFGKTDTRPRKRFFNPEGNSTADDAAASSGQGQSSGGSDALRVPDATNVSYRKLRLLRPKETLDDLLEKLLRNAEKYSGLARENFLEQMLHFLKRNPEMVNRVPNKYHSNPLELTIQLGHTNIAQELLKMKAQVRPENRYLLKKIEHLLRPNRPNVVRYLPGM